jgi:hypothetical protein
LITPESIAKARTEHAEQTALFCWAALEAQKYPELALMFAIPNGGERNKIVAANLKAEGVKASIPDIFLPAARGSWHGLFIELKKFGGRATPEQLKMIKRLQVAGYGAIVCVGWQAGRDTLLSYLNWR